MYHHPKYYAKQRAEKRKLQAASLKQAEEAASLKLQASEASSSKLQAQTSKRQALSRKRQAQ